MMVIYSTDSDGNSDGDNTVAIVMVIYSSDSDGDIQ